MSLAKAWTTLKLYFFSATVNLGAYVASEIVYNSGLCSSYTLTRALLFIFNFGELADLRSSLNDPLFTALFLLGLYRILNLVFFPKW